MKFFAIFAVLALVMASGMLNATVVTATAHSRVFHGSSICDGSTHSYYEMTPQPPTFCTKPPTVACTDASCSGDCVDAIKIDATTGNSFTAPDGSSVSYFYLDPIGQFTGCGQFGCYQNRNAPRASWTAMVYWYTGTCFKWAYADDPRMSPGTNMLVGMPAAGYNGMPGGFYYLPSTPGSYDGNIVYRDITSSSLFNTVIMPFYNLGPSSAGSWGIGTPNTAQQPQTFLYTPAGTSSFIKQQTPFSTNRGTITGTSFYNPATTSSTFDVTVPAASKPKK